MRDLPCGDLRIYVAFDPRRVDYGRCGGVKQERLDRLSANPHDTKRFAGYLGKPCRGASVREVAADRRPDWHAVKEMDTLYMREQLAVAGEPRPAVIGMDEISIRKGHVYRIIFRGLAPGTVRVMVIDSSAVGGYLRTTPASVSTLSFESGRTVTVEAVGFQRRADVMVTLSGPESLRTGTPTAFTVQLMNRGPARADGVEGRVSGVHAPTMVTSDGGAARDGDLAWPRVTLASGETRRLTFTAVVSDTARVTLTASARSDTFDPDSLNNNGSRAEAQRAPIIVRGAQLVLSSRTAGPFTVGVPAALVRVVRNTG